MISLIVAKGLNNEIGLNNKLLCHLSDDLKRFKQLTMNKTIVMGRKTFQSLPKILPNRKHIIITNDKKFFVNDIKVEIEHDIQNIFSNWKESNEEIFIIGGTSIYNYFYPLADKLYLTCIEKEFVADSYFPTIDLSRWSIIEKSDILISNEDISYYFLTLIKNE